MLSIIINAIVKALTLGAFNFADGQIVRRRIETGAIAKDRLEAIDQERIKVAQVQAAAPAVSDDIERMRRDPRNEYVEPVAGDELEDPSGPRSVQAVAGDPVQQ